MRLEGTGIDGVEKARTSSPVKIGKNPGTQSATIHFTSKTVKMFLSCHHEPWQMGWNWRKITGSGTLRNGKILKLSDFSWLDVYLEA